jgi:hypothetical protein
MKSCVVRKRLWATEADNATVTIETEPNFGTPKAAIMLMVETNADTDAFGTLAEPNAGIVFIGPKGDGTSTIFIHSATCNMQDNAGTSANSRRNSNIEFIFNDTTRAATYYRCTSAAFATDKMTLVFANTAPQTNGHIEAICTFFTGDDLTVGIGTHGVSGTVNTANSFTGFNFQPDVLFVASSTVQLNTAVTDDARLSWGCATRLPFKQYVTAFHSENAAGTMTQRSWSSDTRVVFYSTNGTNDVRWSLNSIDATGFTILNDPTTTAGTTNILNFLALKSNPTDYALVGLSTATATGDQFTGLGTSGFIPKTLIGGLTNVTAYNTAQTTTPGADCLSMFAGNRTADSVFYNGTGTITTSTANATVTGTGSSFFVQFAPGFRVYNSSGSSVGTVSSVTSNTSMTLTANSLLTLSTEPYLFSNQGSYCVSYGGEDDAGTSNVFTRISSDLIINVNGATPSNIVVGDMTNFDSRPGFNLNYTTSNASARLGWILAVKDFDTNRRRGAIS